MNAIVFKILLIIINNVWNLNGFYVPGIAPVEFKDDQKIEIKAVKMTSEQYQLPFMYYSLPFCKPKSGNLVYKSENLGEILRGDRIVNTAYEVNMKRNINCKFLCQSINNPMHWSVEDSQKVISRIQHEYYIHLLIDNLPAATKITNFDTNEIQYENGFRLGFMENDHVYINNHLKITLFYHKHAKDAYRVVRFEVEPISISFNDIKPNKDACSISENYQSQLINEVSGTKLLFTYSVEWQESEIVWASRWDIFLNMNDVQIHWFSIINSIIVLFFLTGVISMILIRTLRKDIARYNSELSIDDTIEETGWKLVHGDVFRPPRNSRLFVAIIGSGIQLFFMALITIFFAMLGMLSPASRGALMTTAIFFYVFMGIVAGYYSARLYKTLRGREWKKAAFLTASLYPLVVFITIFVLNFFIWGKKSSGAVPFSTMLELFSLWLFILLPLVYIGYYFGYRKVAFQHPVRTNQIPRQIPEHQLYMHPLISALVAGILPFGAVFIELFFIFTAIWKNQFYYLFGFLFLVFCILVISCSQITIAMIYFQLCAENHNWWWQSLIISGGSAIYVAIYAVIYFITKMDITEFIPTIFYFAYTGIMVFTYWLLTSTIGFFSTYFFIRKIYSAVKID